MTTTVEYDAESGGYTKVTKLGDMVISREYMTFEEYQNYQMNELMKKYWNERSSVGDTSSDDGLLSRIPGFNEISKKVDGLLAIPNISINPSGSADLTFQIVNNYRNDPVLDANRRSVTTFDFDENLQISLNAKIGDLFDFDINWNTQATFDFENKIKLKYEGKEDDIFPIDGAREEFARIVSDVRKGKKAEPAQKKKSTYTERVDKAYVSFLKTISRSRTQAERKEALEYIAKLRLQLDELEKELS